LVLDTQQECIVVNAFHFHNIHPFLPYPIILDQT